MLTFTRREQMVLRERQKDLRREAEKRRLIQEATADEKAISFFDRALATLERSLVGRERRPQTDCGAAVRSPAGKCV